MQTCQEEKWNQAIENFKELEDWRRFVSRSTRVDFKFEAKRRKNSEIK